MPRITLDKVNQMKKNGDLILESEREQAIKNQGLESKKEIEPIKSKTQMKVEAIVKGETLDQLYNVQMFVEKMRAARKKWSKKEIKNYNDLAERITKLKDTLNNIIDAANDDNASKFDKNLNSLLEITYITAEQLELNQDKADLTKVKSIFEQL